MLDKDVQTNIIQLRFILQQPSINWKDFGIDDIEIKLANNPVNILIIIYSFKYLN
jgi:hypothetical protein